MKNPDKPSKLVALAQAAARHGFSSPSTEQAVSKPRRCSAKPKYEKYPRNSAPNKQKLMATRLGILAKPKVRKRKKH